MCNRGERFEFSLMSRPSEESSSDASGARFRRILTEVWQAERRRRDVPADGGKPPISPVRFNTNGAFEVDGDLQPIYGSGSLWEAALAWVEDRDEATAIVAQRQSVDESPESILIDLDLNDNLTHEQLNRRRRLYMWRNHPDRHPEAQRESATRRVAIANMLVDRAQLRLAAQSED
jgi:hypothetical protein